MAVEPPWLSGRVRARNKKIPGSQPGLGKLSIETNSKKAFLDNGVKL
jgi:hypothetical protein